MSWFRYRVTTDQQDLITKLKKKRHHAGHTTQITIVWRYNEYTPYLQYYQQTEWFEILFWIIEHYNTSWFYSWQINLVEQILIQMGDELII